MKEVLLTNAYRPGNFGDKLLVGKSLELIQSLGVQSVQVFSLEPSNFSFEKFGQESGEIKHRNFRDLRKLEEKQIHQSVAFAVGGGYLRFGEALESIKTNIVHVPQIKYLAENEISFALLPQSIGPFNFSISKHLKYLEKAKWIAVRDDRTFQELKILKNIWRCPDLITFDINYSQQSPRGEKIGVIAKRTSNAKAIKEYRKIMEARDTELLIQSASGGRNNDIDFSDRLTKKVGVSSKSLPTNHEIGVVISSRLHGALYAISIGIPAIHIATERKGFGAFQDLGLQDFLVSEKQLESQSILNLANRLLNEDRERYWDLINQSFMSRQEKKYELLNRMKSLLNEEQY